MCVSAGILLVLVKSVINTRTKIKEEAIASSFILPPERDSKIKSKLPGAAWSPPAGRRRNITILRSKIGRVPSGVPDEKRKTHIRPDVCLFVWFFLIA